MEACRRHVKQMPEPPQLAPLSVEEQRLYSELLTLSVRERPATLQRTFILASSVLSDMTQSSWPGWEAERRSTGKTRAAPSSSTPLPRHTGTSTALLLPLHQSVCQFTFHPTFTCKQDPDIREFLNLRQEPSSHLEGTSPFRLRTMASDLKVLTHPSCLTLGYCSPQYELMK